MHSDRANFNPNPTGANIGNYSINVIEVNGLQLPIPSAGSFRATVTTAVDGARNANGVFIGQKVGRDQSKIEFKAPFLTAEEWSDILSVFDNNFVNGVTYFDMQKGSKITRQMYVGDRTADAYAIDDDGNVTIWKDCAFNLIDTGR